MTEGLSHKCEDALSADLPSVRDIQALCERQLEPVLAEPARLFDAGWRATAELGLLGPHLPEHLGGRGASIADAVETLMTFGELCRDPGFCFAVNVTAFSHVPTLAAVASEEQVQRYLQPLAMGQKKCAYALSEAESGSDAFALRCRAEQNDDHFHLRGRKLYVSLAPLADFAIVFASTEPDRGQWGLSAFIVELDQPGIEVIETQKPGLESTPMGEIQFDCRLPKSALLGRQGQGAALFEESQVWERSFILATAVGGMRRQLAQTLRYAHQRTQFGQPIAQHQSISNRLADMKLRLVNSELLIRHAANQHDAGLHPRMESALVKLQVSEAALANSVDAMRITGAKGFTGENSSLDAVGDAAAGLLLAGTNDIQRNLIARLMVT